MALVSNIKQRIRPSMVKIWPGEYEQVPLIPTLKDFKKKSLIFHCYPKLKTKWREACLSTFQYRDVFNGRVIISIVTGPDCEKLDTVVGWFEQFGPDLEFTQALNIPKQGINTTFRHQLRLVQHEDGIVFKSHTKGISHRADPFRVWRENLTKGCLTNTDHVEFIFKQGYRTYSVYKTFSREGAEVMGQITGPHKTTWPGWHYPGAIYWFDPTYIQDEFFELPLHHYENEAFSCHISPTELAYTLTPDNLNYHMSSINEYFEILNTPLRLI